MSLWVGQAKEMLYHHSSSSHLYSLSDFKFIFYQDLKLPSDISKCTCNAEMMKICQASKSEFYANVVFYCQFAGRGKDGHSGQEPARSKKVLDLQILLNFRRLNFWTHVLRILSKFWTH